MSIFAAVRLGDYDRVAELLKTTDPNVKNHRQFSYSLLHYAIRNNNYHIAALLLDHGADQGFKNLFGEIPLHVAIRKGNLDLVRLLLQYRIGTESLNNIKESPLHYAARFGHIEIGRFLLDHDADIRGQNVNGDTPLHYTAIYNFPDFAIMLLQQGAPPDLLNFSNQDFLTGARQKNHVEFLLALEEYYHQDTVARLTQNIVSGTSFLL